VVVLCYRIGLGWDGSDMEYTLYCQSCVFLSHFNPVFLSLLIGGSYLDAVLLIWLLSSLEMVGCQRLETQPSRTEHGTRASFLLLFSEYPIGLKAVKQSYTRLS
jgi:hypothetical protein